MSGAFNTETQQMAQAATHVDDVNTEVQSLLQSLQGSVEAVAAHWVGQAHTTFQGIMARYQDDAKRLSQALTAIAEQIRESGAGYSTQDEAAQQAITSASSGLNMG